MHTLTLRRALAVPFELAGTVCWSIADLLEPWPRPPVPQPARDVHAAGCAAFAEHPFTDGVEDGALRVPSGQPCTCGVDTQPLADACSDLPTPSGAVLPLALALAGLALMGGSVLAWWVVRPWL